MPTYEYACTDCGERLEAVQAFTDPTLTECPACSGRLRKLFSAVGVVFKGSGFYKTDSRADSSNGSKKESSTAADSSSTSPDKATSDSGPSSTPPASTSGSGSDSGSGSGSSTSSKKNSGDGKPSSGSSGKAGPATSPKPSRTAAAATT